MACHWLAAACRTVDCCRFSSVCFWFPSCLFLRRLLADSQHQTLSFDVLQMGMDGVFVGSGIFKSGDAAKRARAIVQVCIWTP